MDTTKRYRSCILATCCVPWDAGYVFAEEIFRRSVRHLIAQGIRDLYIFGTAGEGYAVTETQFDAITRVFLEEMGRARNTGILPVRPAGFEPASGGRDRLEARLPHSLEGCDPGHGVQGMIGLISLSLPAIIERIGRAREMGARRFQLSLPSWGALRDAELETFFRETCGRFLDCEFLHYNLLRAGDDASGAEYGRLAAEHPNLVATKNSTADEARLTSLMREAPQLRHFITEAGFAKAARMGECGFLVSFASTNFALSREYFRAGHERDFARLDEIHRELSEMALDLTDAVADSAHMDGAFDKMFCRLHDAEFPLRLLPPYAAVSEDGFQRYAEILRTKHARWLPQLGVLVNRS